VHTWNSRGRAVSASLRRVFLILPMAGAGRIKIFFVDLEHESEKRVARFRKRSCSNKNLERDGDST
jgi:hypothetical protein